MLTTVLFDLDGTLLPMDQEQFVKCYLGLLARKMAPRGYDPKLLVTTIWKGTEAMYRNDGTRSNEAVFWEVFDGTFGDMGRADREIFEDFYQNEFQQAQESCGFDPRAAETVRAIRAMGLETVLATNPLFPPYATESRVRWAGLQKEDFRLITTYDNARYCKPNPAYYQDILDTLHVSPRECLMVGNDAKEDLAAKVLGIPVFLLTDCLINKGNRDLSRLPQGSFPELLEYIRSLTVD